MGSRIEKDAFSWGRGPPAFVYESTAQTEGGPFEERGHDAGCNHRHHEPLSTWTEDLFYYRDHAGAEIDFVLPQPEGLTLIEAKYTERVRSERLGFEKAEANALGRVAKRRVAAPTGMSQALPMDGFDIYDPRFGS